MPRKRTSRIYARTRGDTTRFYGDFRDVGGGREALIAEGDTRATTDPVVAQKLVTSRLEELQEAKRDRVLLNVRRRSTLHDMVAEHLSKKAKVGKVTERHLSDTQQRLETAIEFFGAQRDVAMIGVEHVQTYLHYLADLDRGRAGTLSASTQLKYLSALSNLFRRAQSEGILRGVNPVEALMEKPSPEQVDAPWLEVWEGALLLEAARSYPYEMPADSSAGRRLGRAIEEVFGTGTPGENEFVSRMHVAGALTTSARLRAYIKGSRIPARSFLETAAKVMEVPQDQLVRGRGEVQGPRSRPAEMLYPLLATFLLTGGRRMEVFGLEIGDVSFQRNTVTFRPNDWRRLKTKKSRRSVPLWPQLRDILTPYIERRRSEGAADDDLLFPSPQTGGLLDNVTKALDRIAESAGWKAGEIRTKAFRHAYCSARLQTLDRGYPISEFVVVREMGHGGHDLVQRVYGHLGKIRHRSEFVEYRVDQQQDVIPAERLRRLMRAV